MVFVNHSTKQMSVKIVYYGPGLCGKTTNLQAIFDRTSANARGEMIALATETDRTLFFDLLPIDAGKVGEFDTRIQLYTVPGQVFYNSTRKLVLKGVDGVVFVADSQRTMRDANVQSLDNLKENLAEMGIELASVPVVLQFNKRDLDDVLSVEELNQSLNRHDWSWVESSAIDGTGVFETLKVVSKTTLRALRSRFVVKPPTQTGTMPLVPPVTTEATSPDDSATGPPAPAPPAPTPAVTAPAATAPMPEATAPMPEATAPMPEATAPTPTAAPPVAAPPAAPPASQEPRIVSRIAEALMRDHVVVGEACLLQIELNRHPSAARDESQASFDALVMADDFDVEGPAQRTVQLVGSAEVEPLMFKLTPRCQGEKRVRVAFVQEGRYAGAVSIKTKAVSLGDGEATAPTGGRGLVQLDRDARAPDLTLFVNEHRTGEHSRSYRFTLHAPNCGFTYKALAEASRFYGSPPHWVEGLYRELGSLAHRTDLDKLHAIGTDLYETLFSRELKQLWNDEVHGKAKSVMIVSDELWIPWELVKPRGAEAAGAEHDFLCSELVVGRWFLGPPAQAVIGVPRGSLSAPGPMRLPHARAAVGELLKARRGGFLGCAWAIPDQLAELFSTALNQTLEGGVRTLGEAVHAARAELRGSPTSAFLAYNLYGDALAQVRFT